MQSEAYKLSGFTLIASALGFLLRWLQDMRIAGEEGLPVNAPISWLVIAATLGTALCLALWVRRLGRFDMPLTPQEALRGRTPLFGAISLIPAVILALAGLLFMVKPGDDAIWPMMHRLCGGTMVLGAFGAAVVAMNAGKESREARCRQGVWMMLVFAVFWLVTGYRDAASDPVVWRFVVNILTQCAVLLAIYYTAGFFFRSPHPKWTMFMCNFAAFLCVMSAIDGSSLTPEDQFDLGRIAQSAAYVAMAVQFFIWGFVAAENMRTKPLTPAEQKKDA